MASKRIESACLAMALVAALATPALAQRVVVFGDSLSDTGNAQFASGGTNPGSPLGRYSNGLNAIDYLYGPISGPGSIAFIYGATLGKLAPGNVLDFAFGGAYTTVGNIGNGTAPGTPGTAPGLSQEVGLFASLGGKFAANDTASVWVGGNNGFYAVNAAQFVPASSQQTFLSTSATQAVAGEVSNLQQLIGLGAKKIIVYNIPDLGTTPLLNTSASGSAAGSFFTATYNATLAGGLSQLAAAAPGTNIIQVDTAALLKIVTNNPTAFGFTNVTQPCGFKGGAACNGFLFADNVHPTQATYAILAQYVNLLTNPTPALQQVSRLGETGTYVNEIVTNQAFDRMSSFVSGTYADRNGPYAEIIGTYGTYDASNGAPGYQFQVGGVRGGIDHKSGATLAGASVSYLAGSTSAGAVKSDVSSFRGDVYGTALFGAAYVSVDGSISSLSLDGIRRQTGIPTAVAEGSTSGYVASAAAEVGYVARVGAVSIIPSGRIAYVHSQTNSYDEASDILAMSFSEQQTDAVLLGGKVRAVTPIAGLGLASTAFGEIGYEGYISTSSNALTASFVNNTAFPTTISTTGPSSPGIIGKLGLSSQISANTFLDLQYGVSVHDDGGATHSGDIRLKATY